MSSADSDTPTEGKRAPEDSPPTASAMTEPATKKAKPPDYMKFGGRREPRVGEAYQATLPSAAVDEGAAAPDENVEPPEEAPAVAQIEESE
jgi:hypothetical protein